MEIETNNFTLFWPCYEKVVSLYFSPLTPFSRQFSGVFNDFYAISNLAICWLTSVIYFSFYV